ncbi:MAG: nucleotide exchange factor GrpE [Desulfovibrionaceae bacterium]|nr:nucleotide exchange factor GrpE [Desulfovibrionaceae bacterium]
MSAKHTIFPPGLGGEGGKKPLFTEGDDELYTGQPRQPADFGTARPQESEPVIGPRGTAKGRAAYAVQENELPPQSPAGPGFGALGGLFAGGPEQSSEGSAPSVGTAEDLLSLVPDARLQEECQKRLCPACPLKKEFEDAHLRALADLDNSKKRLAREREEQIRFAAESVLSDIIPSLDNLDLALQHAGNYEGCKDFVVGVQMTRKLLQDALTKHGLVQAGAVGEEFNPALHEAVGMVDAPGVADNHICSLLSNGYTLNGRLLRPARVMVCKKG